MAGKKKGIIIGSSIAAVVILGVGIVFGSKIGYFVGGSAFDSGKYKLSVMGYKLAGNYLDAPEKLVVAQQALDYSEGEKAFEKGNYQLALEEFTAANGYNDAYTRAAEAEKGVNYVQGVENFENGDYVAAVTCFEGAYTFSDAPEKLIESYYAAAEMLKENGDYVTAGEYYDLSGKDTGSEGVFACGSALMDAGDYENAGYVFGLSNDTECHNYSNYCTGMYKREVGDYVNAVAYLENAGGVEDADELYTETCYQAGLNAVDDGDYTTARIEFERVPDYLESEYYLTVCDFLEAEDCYNKGDLNRSLTVFKTLPEDFEYNGIVVSDRLASLNSLSSFVGITGEWVFEEGIMETRRDYSYYYEWWNYELDSADSSLTVYCTINEDGTVDVHFTGKLLVYSNFESLSAWLEDDMVLFDETINCTSYSSSMDINEYVSVSFSNGTAELEYKKVTTPATYYSETQTTTITFVNETDG